MLLQDEEKRSTLNKIIPSFAQHISQTLIRHFLAYRYVFTHERNEITQTTNVSVNTPIPTRPLSAFKERGSAAAAVEEEI